VDLEVAGHDTRLMVAQTTYLGEERNSLAMVANQERGLALWLRNKLMELDVHSIYSIRERWLRIWKREAGGRRGG
jgi:hypothetical protein